MEALFLKVLEMSVTGSWVILAVLVVRLLLRRAPRKYSYALWAVVAFRLCCPVSFESALSLLRLRQVVAPERTVSQMPQWDLVVPQQPVAVSVPAVSQAVTGSAQTAQTLQTAADPGFSWLRVAAVVWCVGMAALLIYGAVSWAILRRRLRNATRMEGNVYCGDGVRAPFILGLFRPKIYIPYGMEPDTLTCVLAHERYHLRHMDHIVKCFAYILLALHWFNPLCHLAFFLMGRDMEMRCDESVLSGQGANRRAYSMSLLSVAADKHFPGPGPLCFGETGVRSRIKNVLKWKKPRLWVTIGAVLLCVVALIACAANPKADPEPEAPFGQAYTAGKTLFRRLGYGFSFDHSADEDWDPNADPYVCVPYQFMLTGDGELWIRGYINDQGITTRNSEWASLGQVTELTLTEENFDRKFQGDAFGSFDPAAFREENEAAWMIVADGTLPYKPYHQTEFYYLARQKDGEIYIGSGFGSGANEIYEFRCATPGAEDTDFSWGLAGLAGEYVDARVSQLEEQGIAIAESKITEVSQVAGKTLAVGHSTIMAKLCYRLLPEDPGKAEAAGLTMEDGWITEDTGGGKVYLFILMESETDSMQLLCTVDEATMRKDYGIEIEDRYGIHMTPAIEALAGVYCADVIAAEAAEKQTAAILAALQTYYDSQFGDELPFSVAYIVVSNDPLENNNTRYGIMATCQRYRMEDYGFVMVQETFDPIFLTLFKGDYSYLVTQVQRVDEDNPDLLPWEDLRAESEMLYGGEMWKDLLREACCANAAAEWNVDCDGMIRELTKILTDTGLEDTEAMIEAHPEEYRQLINLGTETLRYCYRQFLEGQGAGADGLLWAKACMDILSTRGDTGPLGYESGQAWFAEYRKYVEALADRMTMEQIQKDYPNAYILLEILAQNGA